METGRALLYSDSKRNDGDSDKKNQCIEILEDDSDDFENKHNQFAKNKKRQNKDKNHHSEVNGPMSVSDITTDKEN